MWESNDGGDPVCKTRNELLRTVNTFARTAIIHNKDGENSPLMINNPARMENIFNTFLYKEDLFNQGHQRREENEGVFKWIKENTF